MDSWNIGRSVGITLAAAALTMLSFGDLIRKIDEVGVSWKRSTHRFCHAPTGLQSFFA
jgi:hypothetical protein